MGRGKNEYLVAIRSEGQFIGEMSSFAASTTRCASVRAKGHVRVKIIPGEHLHKCVERIPEVLQRIIFPSLPLLALSCSTEEYFAKPHGFKTTLAVFWWAQVS